MREKTLKARRDSRSESSASISEIRTSQWVKCIEPRYFDIEPFGIASTRGTKANDVLWCLRERQLRGEKLGSTTGGRRLIHSACADDPANGSSEAITVVRNVEVFSLLNGRSTNFTPLGACTSFCWA